MRNYEIQIMVNGSAISNCLLQANNAIDAFELAVENGFIYIPSGHLFEVVCTNTTTGILVRFEAGVI